MARDPETDPFERTKDDIPENDLGSDELTVDLPAWQREILRERLEDLERNPDDGQPWEEVRAELFGD